MTYLSVRTSVDCPLAPHCATVVRDGKKAGHRRSVSGCHPPAFRHFRDQHGRRNGANPGDGHQNHDLCGRSLLLPDDAFDPPLKVTDLSVGHCREVGVHKSPRSLQLWATVIEIPADTIALIVVRHLLDKTFNTPDPESGCDFLTTCEDVAKCLETEIRFRAWQTESKANAEVYAKLNGLANRMNTLTFLELTLIRVRAWKDIAFIERDVTTDKGASS